MLYQKLSDTEKDCHLCFDEMAIDPNDKLYDPSTKSPIGSCTLPGHAGPASKVLCFMLAGVSSRWKVAVAYFYSGNRIKGESMNKTAEGLLQIIKDIITRSHTVGLRVASISSDMGADNRALWRLLGIVGKRSGKVNTTTPHPCDSNRLLHVLPDVPHVFKNIVHMLHSNEIIILPDDIVKENQLPSNIVCWNHIKYLMEHEVKYELKIAYKLLIEKLTSGHFEKMQVGRAKSIFNNQTAAGLIILSDKLKTPAYKTTAWFISVVVRWFELTASRSHGVVLSLAKREEYAEAISHIELTRSVFQRTRVGSKGEWKPAQEGVIIASTSIINLQDYYLNERDYAFLLTSRFNQDCLENLFSQIRRRNKTPNALLFKNILRMILLSGKCFRPPRGHGYEYDEGEMLLGLLLESGAAEPNDSQDSNDIGDYQNVHCPEITDDCIFSIIEDWELLVLYYMAGAALRKCMETFKILRSCDCVQVLSWQGSSHHTFAAVVLERNYKEGALLEVSDECFRAIVKCEINFRILRGSLLKEKNVDVVKELCKKSTYVWKSIACPLCHSDITEKLMVKYFVMRLKQYGQRGKRDVAHILSKFSSRSIAQKEFAKNLNVSHN